MVRYDNQSQPTIGRELIDEFVRSGLVPENCISFNLCVPCNDLVRLEYEVHPTGKKLKGIKLAEILTRDER